MSYSTDSASPAGGWRAEGSRYGGGCGFGRWRPLELAAMVGGFLVFWPIGLAVIGFKMWQRRSGYQGDLFAFTEERARTARETCRSWRDRGEGWSRSARGFGGGFGPRPTGNAAFDDWRAGELAKLEEERRKLEAAEREFADYITQLRRARDREEFDRFMRERPTRAPDAGSPPPAP